MAQKRTSHRSRIGMTLVELLMVITVMTILMAVAIPMIRPAFKDQKLREASRQLNAFCAGAKARAAGSGRPAGIWIEPSGLPGEPQYASRIFMAEVSPSFTGETLGARATVEVLTATTGRLHFGDAYGNLASFSPQSAILNTLVLDGEKFSIRFDYKGRKYTCSRVGNEFQILLPDGITPPGTEHPPLHLGPRPGLTFEIDRTPSKSIVSPETMPGDTVIDLSVSGVGISSTAAVFQNALPTAPVIIMFSPSGQIDSVYVNNLEFSVGGSIYLLVGRRANVIATENPVGTINPEFLDPEKSNLADPVSLWITINNRTGAVTTEDNNVSSILPSNPVLADYLKAAREFARGSRQKGGR